MQMNRQMAVTEMECEVIYYHRITSTYYLKFFFLMLCYVMLYIKYGNKKKNESYDLTHDCTSNG